MKYKPIWIYSAGRPLQWNLIFQKNWIYFGSLDRYFHFVNKETGKKLLKISVDRLSTICTGASIDSKNIYFGVKSGGGKGLIYAVRKKSPKILWKYKTGSLVENTPCVPWKIHIFYNREWTFMESFSQRKISETSSFERKMQSASGGE